jgi:hypothetical protein
MVIPEDTPPPLTALRLASVRRVAGARLFPDSTNLPGPDDRWETWAEGVSDDKVPLAARRGELGRPAPRLARSVRRWLTRRGGSPVDGGPPRANGGPPDPASAPEPGSSTTP